MEKYNNLEGKAFSIMLNMVSEINDLGITMFENHDLRQLLVFYSTNDANNNGR